MSFELAKLQIEANMPLENIRGSLDRAYKAEYRETFDKLLSDEYYVLFPTTRPMLESEWNSDTDLLWSDLTAEDKAELVVVIDYSNNPDYLTLQEYKDETKTVLVGTETLTDDNGVAYESEIFEEQLLRPYTTPLQSDMDTLVDKWLVDFGYVSQAKKDALKYLNETDWFVVRFAEQGVVIPEEVIVKRQEARLVL